MGKPINAAAEQVVRAQSVLGDLVEQQREVQHMIARQQDFISQLSEHAQWGELGEEQVGDADESVS